MKSTSGWGRAVAAVAGRLLLVAITLGILAKGISAIQEPSIDLLGLALAAVFLGVLLMTFSATARWGVALGAAGLWATLTGYGVVAFWDPWQVVADTRDSIRVKVRTSEGAHVLGAFLLIFANLPVALWLASKVSAVVRRGRKATVGAPERHAATRGLVAQEESRRRKRLRAKRRRKKNR